MRTGPGRAGHPRRRALTLLELSQRDAKSTRGEGARRKATPDEMSGGTFTISNMGMMDVENFGAIINPGESAILAVASTQAAAGGARRQDCHSPDHEDSRSGATIASWTARSAQNLSTPSNENLRTSNSGNGWRRDLMLKKSTKPGLKNSGFGIFQARIDADGFPAQTSLMAKKPTAMMPRHKVMPGQIFGEN